VPTAPSARSAVATAPLAILSELIDESANLAVVIAPSITASLVNFLKLEYVAMIILSDVR
jgi:hypothetical protein